MVATLALVALAVSGLTPVTVTATAKRCSLSEAVVGAGEVRFVVRNRSTRPVRFLVAGRGTPFVAPRRSRALLVRLADGSVRWACTARGSRVPFSRGRLYVDPPTISARVAGPEQLVFDWSSDRCDAEDIPDLPARALRDSSGRVHVYASHYRIRRMSGSDLNSVVRDCAVVHEATRSPRADLFADREWLASLYTEDGTTVYGLLHVEYQGWEHPTGCVSRFPDHFKCWYNAITLAVSRDGGRTFAHARTPPEHLVAALPYRYVPETGPEGMMDGSGIVRHPTDGFYYSTVTQALRDFARAGVCVMRARDLSEPGSWRAWDGTGWGHRFIDPYRESPPSQAHFCAALFSGRCGLMGQGLTWNRYLERFVLVGTCSDGAGGGFYFSTSRDLVEWSQPELLVAGELTYTYQCGDENPMAYASLLDPESPSASFDVTGRSPYLYFTRFRYDNCRQTLDRDLVRVAVDFSRSDE